ncbi:dipeptidase [Luteimonas huabeiensis]|uniref:dipeptidase n=1 Tax=Luteimonas huabeiensis TaxID=1244513 RepID=UPI000464D0B0|nr:dipeptidase [Luteimonas huabeiensis]
MRHRRLPMPRHATALLAALCLCAGARADERPAVGIVDTHIDAPALLQSRWADLGADAPDREFDYPRARAGGLAVAFMSIYTSAEQDASGAATQAAHAQIDAVEALAARHPDKFALLRSPRDVERLRAGGRVLLPLGMENAAPIGDDLSRLRLFHDRGIRYVTLAHGAANRFADSSYDIEKKWGGLSPLGREAVAEMNRLGIMVDVSHLSDEAAAQAIELSRAPVIASHSSFRGLTPGFERNIGDALARRVAAKGGVVQVTFGTNFVEPEGAANLQALYRARNDFNKRNARRAAAGLPPEDRAAFEAEWRRTHPRVTTTIERVLDHIDYGVALLGVEHVGIGSDFDGVGGNLPRGLRSVADYPALIDGLRERGYAERDIARIAGGNLLRVWAQVEDAAERGGRDASGN